MMKTLKTLIALIGLLSMSVQYSHAQEDNSYDALMAKMREYTWEKKEYGKAIEIGKELLQRYPNNTSVEQFLGNLYFYTDQDSLAIPLLEKALSKEPLNTDILNSLFHLSFKQEDYEAAGLYLDRLMAQDADNPDYRLRREQIATRQTGPERTLKNGVGIMFRQLRYSQGLDPKTLISGRYIRKQGKATIVATGTYGEHFGNRGILLESELYYNHTKDSYSHGFLNWSNKKELFAEFNAGYTYFRNVGNGWVPGLGARYTHSDGSNVYTAVADVSKYWGRNLTAVRFYGIIDDHNFYQAYNFSHRYNFTANNYLQFMYTLGTSPDDKTRLAQSNLDFKAHSFSLFGNVRLSQHFDTRAYFNYTRQKISPTSKYSIYEAGIELVYNF